MRPFDRTLSFFCGFLSDLLGPSVGTFGPSSAEVAAAGGLRNTRSLFPAVRRVVAGDGQDDPQNLLVGVMLAEIDDVRVAEAMRFVGQLASEGVGRSLSRCVFCPITIQSRDLIFA